MLYVALYLALILFAERTFQRKLRLLRASQFRLSGTADAQDELAPRTRVLVLELHKRFQSGTGVFARVPLVLMYLALPLLVSYDSLTNRR